LQSLQEIGDLKRQLDEKTSEVGVLKEQNTVYASDFQLERQDRERSQSRLIELEEQLAASTRRIVELEDEKYAPARVHEVRKSIVFCFDCILFADNFLNAT